MSDFPVYYQDNFNFLYYLNNVLVGVVSWCIILRKISAPLSWSNFLFNCTYCVIFVPLPQCIFGCLIKVMSQSLPDKKNWNSCKFYYLVTLNRLFRLMVICWTDISHWIMVGQFVSIFCLFHNACVCPCHFLRRYGSSLGVLIAESLYTSTEHMQKTHYFPKG